MSVKDKPSDEEASEIVHAYLCSGVSGRPPWEQLHWLCSRQNKDTKEWETNVIVDNGVGHIDFDVDIDVDAYRH